MSPERIQLKRTKGWKMPPNTVSVARPGRWGNPHWISRFRDRDTCIALFRDSVLGCWSPRTSDHLSDVWAQGSYEAHHAWMKKLGGHPTELARSELRGKNLACWCKIGQPCHTDVLLELANPEDRSVGDVATRGDTKAGSGIASNTDGNPS